MDINEVKWKLNRLKAMKPSELAYRTRQLMQKKYEKTLCKLPNQKCLRVNEVKIDLIGDKSEFIINSSTFFVYGKAIAVNDDIDFLKDYFTGLRFKLQFAKEINIKADQNLSAKRVWEVNRLNFLLPLLLDYRYNDKKECLDLFVSILSSWKQQNPYLLGINWYSNIEVNIRLINWYWCWLLLQNDARWNNEERFRIFKNEVWLPLIYQHYYYSYNNFSFYSSANNHLIAEYAGLFVTSALWKFKESEYWLSKSKEGLEQEIVKQHSVNGINKEESAEYIQFVTDFFLVSLVVAEQHKLTFSEDFKNSIIKICDYINNFLDIKDNYPKYGDDDDGVLLTPNGGHTENNFISILNTAAILFDKPYFKRPNAIWDLKSNLLTAHVHGALKWSKLPFYSSLNKSIFYEEEGHFIFRKKEDDKKEIYCHFDAAPLGFLAIAAHGHSDALSFIIHLDGQPVFVDPGTFCYHTDADWRKYFLSSLAHNTVTINGKNQAKYIGPTLWQDHYKVVVRENRTSDGYDYVIAEHDGYKKYNIKHIRKVEFFKKSDRFVITDQIVNTEQREITIDIPFHIFPEFSCSLSNYNLKFNTTSRLVEVSLDKKLEWSIFKGSTSPMLGWYSSSFYRKDPCQVCIGRVKTSQSIFISCQIRFSSLF